MSKGIDWKTCRLTKAGGIHIGFRIFVSLWNPFLWEKRTPMAFHRYANAWGLYFPGISISRLDPSKP